MNILKEILLTIWQLPQDIVGAVIWLICKYKNREVEIYEGRVLTHWKLGSGLSLGHFIFVSTYASINTIRHEFGHTRQSRLCGWLYLFVIGLPSIIWCGCFEKVWRKEPNGYYKLYTEKYADLLGGVFR